MLIVRRLYFFEVFALANFGLIAVLGRNTVSIVGSPFFHWVTFTTGMLVPALAGIAVRVVISLVRRDPAYLRIIRSPAWIVDTLRMMVSGGLVVTTYGWIKLVVPVLHPRFFDLELWELDQRLFFGMAPTTFLVEVLDSGLFLWMIDRAYVLIFGLTAFVAFSYVLSEPSRRVRISFSNGNALLWIGGAWLYMLVPSVGPAYRFPEVWLAHAQSLDITQSVQRLLMRNFQNVILAGQGRPVSAPINIVFGVGAFPSLHVAFQAYVFFWLRRFWPAGELLFGFFVFVILIGSMITGWHYLVDGLAGIVMAYGCHRVFWRRGGLERFLERRKR